LPAAGLKLIKTRLISRTAAAGKAGPRFAIVNSQVVDSLAKRINSMAKTILVVLNPEDNVHVLLRRLERVVKPGNRIVFLVEYQRDIPSWLLAHVALLQTGLENGLACQERRAWLSWDEQKIQVEENVAEPARRVFSRMGIEICVDLYSGSLNRILRRYLELGEVTLILVATSSWLRRLKIVPTRMRNWFVRRRPATSRSFWRTGGQVVER
jgi:hypothetical protein